MKIKSPHFIFATLVSASTLISEAGTTKLNANGSWGITNPSTAGTRFLDVFGDIRNYGTVSSYYFTATGECDFNGVTVGKGNGNLQYNVAIGAAVLDGGSQTGNGVTGVGSYALQNNSSGSNNTAVGHAAMQMNTTGQANTASGLYALNKNTTGSENTAAGVNSLVSNTIGNYNTGCGVSSLYANSSGIYNTAMGLAALADNTTGNYNTGIGAQSLLKNLGGWNTALGVNSLVFKTIGNANTAIGNDTANRQRNGQNLTSAEGCVYIGANALAFTNGESNAIVIGTGAWGEGTNTTVIGNGATVSTHLYGKTISESLQVNGSTVLSGGTVLSGKVTLSQAQGDIPMLVAIP